MYGSMLEMRAFAFASGMAAEDCLLRTVCRPGDRVLIPGDAYGGTYRLFTKIFERSGIKFHFVNMQEAANIDNYTNKNTRLIWAETPTNPLMNIIDISAVAAIAKKNAAFCFN